MTIQEAKEFFFLNLCSEYGMFNTDATKYAEFNNIIDLETKKKFCLKYMDILSKRIYDEPEKSAFSFCTMITKLGSRDKDYKSNAERVVRIFEKCPFPDDFAKLMVMESMVGSAYVDGWGSGYSILCFYDDYSERIRLASEQYIHVTFEKSIPAYYKSACHVPIEVMNNRAENVRTLNTERFQYVHSAEFKSKLRNE